MGRFALNKLLAVLLLCSGLAAPVLVHADDTATPAATTAAASDPGSAPAEVPVPAPEAAPAEAAPAAPKLDSGDTAWMLSSTALVLLMTIPGLALFYGGMVRKKNVLATIMQSFAITALVTVLWMVCGYSMAFSTGGPYIGGLSKAFLNGIGPDTLQGTIPETVFMTFQMTFAIITPALICGAFAERMKFSAMLMFITLWSLLVYCPITHWVWSTDGWLANYKPAILDYAGGTVVHVNAGVAGLVCAFMLGKRIGFGREAMPPHNLALTVTGAALLWVGWFGFNAGSAVAANGRAGMAMAATQIATGAAALSWMFAEWYRKGSPSVLGIASGAVAGLVAVTPASGFVDPRGALIIGLVAGIACYWGATALKRFLGADDSLDVFGVHGVGGAVGAVLTGMLVSKQVAGVEPSVSQVLTQLVGVGATAAYDLVATFIILLVVDIFIGLRVQEDDELIGLDLSQHHERID
jgi:Amt family ammonium transporter